MPIRLRFALHGTRHNRIFHLVAIDRGQRRDAKPTETLGIYNPHLTQGQRQKTIEWSVDRIRYWLQVGAIPSKSVARLLETHRGVFLNQILNIIRGPLSAGIRKKLPYRANPLVTQLVNFVGGRDTPHIYDSGSGMTLGRLRREVLLAGR